MNFFMNISQSWMSIIFLINKNRKKNNKKINNEVTYNQLAKQFSNDLIFSVDNRIIEN